MADEKTVLWVERHRSDVTVGTVAAQLAGDTADKQAAILLVFAEDIASWRSHQSWASQCRAIADELDEFDRAKVAGVLQTLVEHLTETREAQRAARAVREK